MASYVMSLVFFMVHAALCFNIVDEGQRTDWEVMHLTRIYVMYDVYYLILCM